MVWIALGLLALTATVVALNTAAGRWGMARWRSEGATFQQWLDFQARKRGSLVLNQDLQPIRPDWPAAASRPAQAKGAPPNIVPLSTDNSSKQFLNVRPFSPPWQDGILIASQLFLDQSGFVVFSNFVVFSVFLSFLLPIWSLSFATEALGGEREARSLIWLLTRPMPRPAIYLAKFAALLPWSLGLNLCGFWIVCAAAGQPGFLAFRLYWQAVLCGSLAFCSLFHLMGACFRRSAVVAIVYSFFLETIVGNMPGYMKRVSISFYTRCMMFEQAEALGVQPQKPSVYLPVDGSTALCALAGLTVLLLFVGMAVFARSEYQDLT